MGGISRCSEDEAISLTLSQVEVSGRQVEVSIGADSGATRLGSHPVSSGRVPHLAYIVVKVRRLLCDILV